MADDANKKFVREAKTGFGTIITFIVCAVLVFGGLTYILIEYGDKLALPKPGQ